MADPWAVLVVPATGDPGGLLAPGACGPVGALVQSSHVCTYPWHKEWKSVTKQAQIDCYMCHCLTEALPLWWYAAPVPEGWDRARRVWARGLGYLTGDDWPSMPTIGQVNRLATVLAELDFASRVVLLDRVGGRLVERAP